MIFSRKYTFESRATRARRFLLNAGVVLGGVALLYGTFLVTILVVARGERQRWAEGLFQKAPDAIVAFTGDQGRIKRALELSKRWPEAQILIYGGHGANSLRTLVAGQMDAEELLASPTPVELDYEALDTIGNVRETLEHLGPKARNLLVVTSDYHVLRVRMIFAADTTANKPNIYYESIPGSWDSWRQVKKLLLESVKIARTWLLFLLA